jgi:xanthine dehydrogenase accessory factor
MPPRSSSTTARIPSATSRKAASLSFHSGLDLGPITHEEIAVAVLAEVVKLKAEGLFEPAEPAAEVVTEARDPVCGMTVRTDSRHRAEHEGETYYFCCGGCRERFVAAPASFS